MAPLWSPSPLLALSLTDRISFGRKQILTQDWTNLTWASAYIISQSPHISVPTTSAYLHRYVICREISDWRLGQESMCNSIIVTIMFHNFFSSLARSTHLSLFSFLFFLFFFLGCQYEVRWDCKVRYSTGSLFFLFSLFCLLLLLLNITGFLAEIWRSVCISNSENFVSHSPGQILVFTYDIVHMVKFLLLSTYPVDHFLYLVESSFVNFFFLCYFSV